MADITYTPPSRTYTPPIRSLIQAGKIAAILAVALVAASIKIEECKSTPGAFSSDFSSDFDVSRKTCGQSALASTLASKIANVARTIILR